LTEYQRFRTHTLVRLKKFTWIILSALYVSLLTALAMKLTSLLVLFLFDGHSLFADGLEYFAHACAISSFVASLISDLLHQLKGTDLGELLGRMIAGLGNLLRRLISSF
jgi:hypothetical protein